jgi:hypothetical protein
MPPSLTITFISKKTDHPTNICYDKFGSKYWDDHPNNRSKIGGYFVYYYKKHEVRIHKIINVLKPSERPADMEWESDRNILCFGPQLKVIKWGDWINGIGNGAPFAKDKYRNGATFSWSQIDLNKKFAMFDYNKFINFVDDDTLYKHYQTLQEDKDSLNAELKQMNMKYDDLQKAIDILTLEQNKIKKEIDLLNKI